MKSTLYEGYAKVTNISFSACTGVPWEVPVATLEFEGTEYQWVSDNIISKYSLEEHTDIAVRLFHRQGIIKRVSWLHKI